MTVRPRVQVEVTPGGEAASTRPAGVGSRLARDGESPHPSQVAGAALDHLVGLGGPIEDIDRGHDEEVEKARRVGTGGFEVLVGEMTLPFTSTSRSPKPEHPWQKQLHERLAVSGGAKPRSPSAQV